MSAAVIVLVCIVVLCCFSLAGMGYTVRCKNRTIREMAINSSSAFNSSRGEKFEEKRTYMDQRTVSRVRSTMESGDTFSCVSSDEAGIAIVSDVEADFASEIAALRALQYKGKIEVWSRDVAKFNKSDDASIRFVEHRSGKVVDVLMKTKFNKVLVLSAGARCLVDPTGLLESPELDNAGAVFFPSLFRLDASDTIFEAFDAMSMDEFQCQTSVFLVNRAASGRAISAFHSLSDTYAFRECWLGTETPFETVHHPCSVVGRFVDGTFTCTGLAHRWTDGRYCFVTPMYQNKEMVFPMWEVVMQSDAGDSTRRIVNDKMLIEGDSVRTYMATDVMGYAEDMRTEQIATLRITTRSPKI